MTPQGIIRFLTYIWRENAGRIYSMAPWLRPHCCASRSQWLDLLEKVPFFPQDGPLPPDPYLKKRLSPLGIAILCLCGAGALALLAALIHAL